jgi:hypothetical protein
VAGAVAPVAAGHSCGRFLFCRRAVNSRSCSLWRVFLSSRCGLALPNCPPPEAWELTKDVSWIDVAFPPKYNIPEARVLSRVNADASARFVGLDPASLQFQEVFSELSLPACVLESLDASASSGDALWHGYRIFISWVVRRPRPRDHCGTSRQGMRVIIGH